jgi:hypothetical protein
MLDLVKDIRLPCTPTQVTGRIVCAITIYMTTLFIARTHFQECFSYQFMHILGLWNPITTQSDDAVSIFGYSRPQDATARRRAGQAPHASPIRYLV